MRKNTIFVFCVVLAALFSAACSSTAQYGLAEGNVYGAGAGRAGRNTRQVQQVTVSQVGSLPNEARVILAGNIVGTAGREKYIFRDSTGEITVEIERKKWQGLSVGPFDNVEITGKVERKFLVGRIIEVKSVRKL